VIEHLERILLRINLIRPKPCDAQEVTAPVQGDTVSDAPQVDAVLMRRTQQTSMKRGCYKLKARWNDQCDGVCPKGRHHHHHENCLMFDAWPYSGKAQIAMVRERFPNECVSAERLWAENTVLEAIDAEGGTGWISLPKKRRVAPRRAEIPPWERVDPELALVGCPKVSYSSELDARLGLARELAARHDETAYYYHCLNGDGVRGCGRWHIGHRESNRRANQRFREAVS